MTEHLVKELLDAILHRGRGRDRDRTWRRDFLPSIGWSWYYIESVHVNKQAHVGHLVPAVQRDGSRDPRIFNSGYIGSLSHFDLDRFYSKIALCGVDPYEVMKKSALKRWNYGRRFRTLTGWIISYTRRVSLQKRL